MPKYIESSIVKKNPELYEKIDISVSWILKDNFTYDYFNRFNKDSKILDVGCGNGHFLDQLKDRGYNNLRGVDIANYLKDKSHQHHIVDINVSKLPFEDNSFDVVTTFQTFEHLENYFLLEQEIKRILKPDGYFIFSIPNHLNFFYRFKFAFTGNMEGWSKTNNHLLFLTRDVFEKSFLKDFDLVKMHYDKGHVPFLGRLKFIRFLKLKSRTKILPRSEFFSAKACYILKKK